MKMLAIKEVLLCLSLVPFWMLLMFAEGCYAMEPKDTMQGKRLYTYSASEFSRLFKRIGRPDFWENMTIYPSRNSDGTELRFVNSKAKKVVAIKCDGTVIESGLPGFPTWFNDSLHPVAWHDQSAGLVHYSDGMKERISGAFGPQSGPDPSGKYFIKYPNPASSIPLVELCVTDVYAIANPEYSLATIKTCGNRIFSKPNRVIVFGKDYVAAEKDLSDAVAAHILESRDGRLIEREGIDIPPPSGYPINWWVEDMCPWEEEDKILLVDGRDVPFRSIWYEFNLKTREMRRVGKKPFSGGWGFYLQCDIIKEVAKKLNGENRDIL